MKISWEYLAGLLDGEGSVGTTRTGKYRNVVGRVVIANTDTLLLGLLQAQFGGSLSIRERGSKPGWKPFASLSWTNRGAQYILERVLPHLIVKRSQAELCLELIRMKDATKSDRFAYVLKTLPRDKIGGTHCTMMMRPEVRSKEEAIAAQLKSLNAKGLPN